MTRETKIGLLVGLAFIIVIGILFSDFLRGRGEAPPATLGGAGANVRQTVTSPGVTQESSPVTMAPPQQTNPRTPVQTPGDLQPPTSPVVLAPPQAEGQSSSPLPANDPLQRAAERNGEQLVPADQGGTQTQVAAAQRTYRAEAGDTVSRMASKFLGANTYKNRQAIIAANASLQDDPDKVVVGQDYTIPVAGGAAAQGPASIPGTVPVASGSAGRASASATVYVVREGDTLWGIATGQLGDANAVATIKALNRNVLHGSNNLQVGMKLRLPAASVVVAD